MEQATDAEDYQAVGVRCRETLLALAREHTGAPWVPVQPTPPKTADFKGWLDLYAEALATGRVRAYLKTLAERTWDLTVWLQHYTDATERDADLVLEATGHLLVIFMYAAARHEQGTMRRCPECDSYRVTEDLDVTEQNGVRGLTSNDVCLACGWTGESSFESFSDRHRKIAAHKARHEG